MQWYKYAYLPKVFLFFLSLLLLMFIWRVKILKIYKYLQYLQCRYIYEKYCDILIEKEKVYFMNVPSLCYHLHYYLYFLFI